MAGLDQEFQTARELKRRIYYLQVLHDVNRELGPLLDLRVILKVASMTLAGALGTADAMALLQESREGGIEVILPTSLETNSRQVLESLFRDGMGVLEQDGAVRVLTEHSDSILDRKLGQAGLQVWIPFQIEGGLGGGLGLGKRWAQTSYEAEDLKLLETIQMTVQQALYKAYLYEALQVDNAALGETLSATKHALSQSGEWGEFVGNSPALRQMQMQLTEVAPTDVNVLILGETGTGKGLTARKIHELSQQSDGPFLQVNCGALPEHLIESELFGHEKGAFTGAHARKLGKVELAAGGTLFLDEIGDMPLDAQVKLLQLLEERVFERVGGTETLQADVRVVAATNRDLEGMVREQTFREDLYFRLQVYPVQLPPLRQRQEDIPLLARYAMEQFTRHLNRPVTRISPGAMAKLQTYAWPGNVRELEHLMQRAVLLCKNDSIEPEDIVFGPGSVGDAMVEEGFLSLAEHEKQYIVRALEATEWVIFGKRGAAQLLGINPHTLRSRMKKYGLQIPR